MAFLNSCAELQLFIYRKDDDLSQHENCYDQLSKCC